MSNKAFYGDTASFPWPIIRRSAIEMDETGFIFGGRYRLMQMSGDRRERTEAQSERVLALLSVAYR